MSAAFEITLAEMFEMAWNREPSKRLMTIDGVTLVRFSHGDAQFVGRPGAVAVQVTDYLVNAISDALAFR